MPAAVAVPAVLGAAGIGAQIYGAHKAAGAAKSAAEIQSQAADKVAGMATEAAQSAQTGVTDAARAAQTGVTEAAAQSTEKVEGAAGTANETLKGYYDSIMSGLSPYTTGGQQAVTSLTTALAPGGDLTKTFTGADMEAYDPGYQFRLQQAQKALERSAAARGSLQSGGTLKALASWQQNLASDEYARAFERFRAQQQDRYGRLSDLSRLGLSATNTGVQAGEFFGGRTADNTMRAGELGAHYGFEGAGLAGQFGLRGAESAGRFGLEGAQIAGDALTGGANARAAGKVGAANAWNQGIGGAINTGFGTVGMIGANQGWFGPDQRILVPPAPSGLPMSEVIKSAPPGTLP